MRQVVLDTDVASLIIKQRLPGALLREIVGAQISITFVSLGESTHWATKFGATVAGSPRTCRYPRSASSRDPDHGDSTAPGLGTQESPHQIDALAAVMLDITAEDSVRFTAFQSGVLRNCERAMQFDSNGRQLRGRPQREDEKHGSRADLGRYELPLTSIVHEAEMAVAHKDFSRRVDEREAINISGSIQR